jgi:hypothetical protein
MGITNISNNYLVASDESHTSCASFLMGPFIFVQKRESKLKSYGKNSISRNNQQVPPGKNIFYVPLTKEASH